MEMALITIMAILFAICFCLGVKLLFELAELKSVSRFAMEKVLNAVILFMLAGASLMIAICGGFLLQNKEPEQPDQAVLAQELCEENYICYELVETLADYTDYTELEIAEYFVIVYDNVDAFVAIQMLDDTLDDDQIQAIMEISAMKQER